MLNIALKFNKGATSIMDISNREGISIAYLEQLLNKLKHEGLVDSIRGPKGGYVLTKAPDEITVADVVKTLEKDVAPVHCVTVRKNSPRSCRKSKSCVTKGVWEKLARSISECLESVTLKDLCNETRRQMG